MTGLTGGSIIRINTYATGNQLLADVTLLANGGYVIAWTSEGQDGDGTGVYLQRYGANGTKAGGEVHVSTSTIGIQENSAVAALAGGGWVVTWSGNGTADTSDYGVYQQRYAASGKAVGGEMLVNSYTTQYQYDAEITALDDGGWITVWSGSGNTDTTPGGVFMNRYDSAGKALLSDIRVNTTVPQDQLNASVATLDDGGWVVVWQGRSAIDDLMDVYQQRYDAKGLKVGGEVEVNTWTTNFQQNAAVTGLKDGGWVVAWNSSEQDADSLDVDVPNTSDSNIYIQRYDHDGHVVKGETRVNSYQTGTQAGPDVTGLADGSFIVSWWGEGPNAGSGVMFQHYDEDGRKIGGQQTASALIGGVLQDVVALVDGGFIMTWNAYDFSSSSYEIYHRRYSPDITGANARNDTLAGTTWSERLQGLSGNDKLDGKAGADFLDGGRGNDTLKGGTGIDTFIFLTGYDRDRITDFAATGKSHDIIDLSALKAIRSWADLVDNHMKSSHGDVIINGGNGDVLTLADVKIGQLDKHDFLF
jgi:hypothetical protein